MTSTILTVKQAKESYSRSRKTFDKLRKQIGNLERELKTTHLELDECLSFYQGRMHPQGKALNEAMAEIVKIFYEYYKKPNFLPKKKRSILKDLIVDRAVHLLGCKPSVQHDAEMRAIFEELEGIDYQEISLREMKKLKESLQEEFEMHGVDLDLSNLNLESDEFDIMEKIAEAIKQSQFGKADYEGGRKKNKKELNRELKEKEEAALQKKCVGGLYKTLAKVLHPDLEQDPRLKTEKEDVMKKLTVAYSNNDLHSLLSLESKYLNIDEGDRKRSSDDRLDLYIGFLKKQVKEMERAISEAILHPRYSVIQPFVEGVGKNRLFVLKRVLSTMKSKFSQLSSLHRDLQVSDSKEIILKIISEYADYNY